MPALRTACIDSPIDREYHGLRILVTRYTARGRSRVRYDAWMPNLAPSERLLKALQAQKITWAEFQKRYETELFEPATFDKHNPTIKNHGQKFTLRLLKKLAQRQPVTLLCTCEEDEVHCHRNLLKALLNSRKV